MTDLERMMCLILSLGDALTKKEDILSLPTHKQLEFTAQYLLANGAIVMPCKTGDEVYRISKRYGKWVILPREVGCITYSITYQNEIIWQLFTTTLDVLGVTVFLTREDAEEEIRRRKEVKPE